MLHQNDTPKRRAVLVEGIGKLLEISRFTVVDLPRLLFHLDALDDGTWRLTVSKNLGAMLTHLSKIDFYCMGTKQCKAEWRGIAINTPIQSAVALPQGTGKGMIHFDETKGGGRYRLVMGFTNTDFKITDITALTMILKTKQRTRHERSKAGSVSERSWFQARRRPTQYRL